MKRKVLFPLFDFRQERARLVEDFVNRRKEAGMNKQRGQAALFGPSPSDDYRRPPSGEFGI